MNNKLDIAFCVDNTGSMGTYIVQVQKHITFIVQQIVASEKADVMFGLVRYRDFTDDFVTKEHPFTSSLHTMKSYVDQMGASGGGDGPEAVSTTYGTMWGRALAKYYRWLPVFMRCFPLIGGKRQQSSLYS
jgi:hypothetical protein